MSVTKQKCSRCQKLLDLSEYSTRADTGNLHRQCKNCIAERKQHYYLKNKESYIKRAAVGKRKRRAEIRDRLNQLKSNPCVDCGNSYPYYVMDLDHLRDKEWTPGDILRMCPSDEIIEQEFAKCEVVCANCHRERTYKRGQYYTQDDLSDIETMPY